ncbi:hypothetical protein [uncultured Fretibacterium sp.]|uniref:hypothetical protein n=1 Tax=uncultured Fretibacterium sp. TaxID=1678694 RepID=UPI0026210EF2|nr:hypothetical protein [uncultured Fretibacterium sp.]
MMGAPAFENLDLACARTGQAIAEKPSKELEKLVTSALAVLEEQGVYALFLFLKTRGGKTAPTIVQEAHKLLRETPRRAPLLDKGNGDVFESLQSMSEDLDKLLLARDLLRQALVYARYHARGPEKSESRT